MKLKFRLVFKRGQQVIATVTGEEVDTDRVTIQDVTDKVIETEHFIERLTGVRCHIEQVG